MVNFLKPEPAPRREAFVANLPAEFRRLWEMSEAWEHWTAPHHTANFEVMPHEMSDLADDGTTSKSRCREKAGRQLRRAYAEAERFLGTGTDGMSAFVLERLKEYLTEQFHCAHHLLRLMADIPGIKGELENGFLCFLEKAFVRYNFDGSTAYFNIREDAQRRYDAYRDEVGWFLPDLLASTYSRRVREYLAEIAAKLGAEKAAE